MHVQLSATRIDKFDLLATEVPNANDFVMRCISETTKCLNISVSSLLLSQQHAECLQALIDDTGVSLN